MAMSFGALLRQAANYYNMTAARAIKGTTPQIVAVLSSVLDLQQATRMRRLPDLFELRLDALYRDLPMIEHVLARLSAPLIITARHPLEGGLNKLSVSRRRELLRRFLPRATCIDVELRSVAQLRPILAAAGERKIKRIISVHDLRRAPAANRLDQWAREAESLAADVFKIVIRTETAEQFEELAKFYQRTRTRMEVSAMGVGKFGRASRIYFATHGSGLNYVHLGSPRLEGQLSLQQMRRFMAHVPNRRA
jgi:3-dehydroquinate dehydratase-1